MLSYCLSDILTILFSCTRKTGEIVSCFY